MRTALTPLQVAVRRAPVEPFARQRFLFALEQARLITLAGGDLDAEWQIASRDAASTAGHIEGLAALRTETHR